MRENFTGSWKDFYSYFSPNLLKLIYIHVIPPHHILFPNQKKSGMTIKQTSCSAGPGTLATRGSTLIIQTFVNLTLYVIM